MAAKKPAPKKKAPAKKAAPKKMGRPSHYTDAIADAICLRLANGQSLLSICKAADMPARSCVLVWLANRPDFVDKYARARDAQADLYAAQVVEIADKVRPAVKRTVKMVDGKEQVERVHTDAVERSRLMMDARKWYAAKLAPKKYSEKIQHGGAEDLPPLPAPVTNVNVTVSPAEAYKRMLERPAT